MPTIEKEKPTMDNKIYYWLSTIEIFAWQAARFDDRVRFFRCNLSNECF